MTIRLTHIEDALATAPDAVSRKVGTQLDAARLSLEKALRTPLSPAQHTQVQNQMQAIVAARAILERIARCYGSSYGRSS